ncbi:hypothetical protein [Gemelliphila palaticanis]|uniref:Uncharacterized protein n=1 Tax=Gemelliphila palaticanis TaxID=81950 RepID=A0ABX2T2C2_9BACL|nr:hypothetical protein [Gemella palaticanis]MBF0715679.1 hypothetical protein [Gemella palaticanis]NYS47609.1 hypothetical protein [Gemella palaticanis]
MDNLTNFLKNNINQETSLENIVNIFEKMCEIPAKEDMILFETGTFTTSLNTQMFQVSFVRQFSNEDEEFLQVRVDILYEPDNENKMFNGAVWAEDLSKNIFDYIRNSKVFTYAKNKEYCKVKIWCDET